ncbi:hypothetical protein CapIbe_000798 [Capra ibex]
MLAGISITGIFSLNHKSCLCQRTHCMDVHLRGTPSWPLVPGEGESGPECSKKPALSTLCHTHSTHRAAVIILFLS